MCTKFDPFLPPRIIDDISEESIIAYLTRKKQLVIGLNIGSIDKVGTDKVAHGWQ